ncbi:lactate utilization protein C [Alicyclobacillus cycloheptanicus]|uniref:L-lactate dehydrogenase complex protein LldG n=1 Tax=Alicyclobacillus cycloheptanicus TaxID=1457 RepID=A0ABT9XFY7_9BACL|nr:lactate utilization protein C [Alicyclobacillus cycloheptanicus]MDQ0189107.1 L-lactate dehydrogenase complex protein LldG [Alicyclobacillus cycloheptanicus]WDM00237.1 lactate utilization protein C [Alicyclobacillus cycloheptanicus]
MNKEAFLTRIASQLGRSSPLNEAPTRQVVGVPDFWREYALSKEARITHFEERFVQLGGAFHRVKDAAELQEALRGIFADLQPERIGMWNDAQLRQLVLPAVSSEQVVTWGVDEREAFTSIDIGITGCTAAVADTGTLVLACGAGRGRSVHLLPPVHLAIVGASQFVTRLGEALARIADAVDQHAYVHLVTGPSRSSDIENDQTIGIHGPAAVIVIVVDDWEPLSLS